MTDLELLLKEGEGLTVEFKEKYTSKIVADICAFANSRGGTILLGVADDGTVRGEKLTAQMKAEIFNLGRNCDPAIEVFLKQVGSVVSVDVPMGSEKPYTSSGVYYKRFDAVTQKLTRNEVKSIFEANAGIHFDERLNPKASIDDLSLEKVRAFVKESGKAVTVTKKSLPFLLSMHETSWSPDGLHFRYNQDWGVRPRNRRLSYSCPEIQALVN